MISRATYWMLYDASLRKIAAYLEMDMGSLHRAVSHYCTITGVDAHVGLRHQRARILHQLRNG